MEYRLFNILPSSLYLFHNSILPSTCYFSIGYFAKLALPLLLSPFCRVAQLTLPNCQVHVAKYFSLVDYPNLDFFFWVFQCLNYNYFGLSSLLFNFIFLIGCLFPTPFLSVLFLSFVVDLMALQA